MIIDPNRSKAHDILGRGTNERPARAGGARRATTDFGKFGDAIFSDDVAWTIKGYGLVARTFRGMKDLIDNAEQALFDRWDGTAAVEAKGVWADGDKVFAHLTPSAKAIDGLPYANEHLYILTMKERRVVAGTAWLDLHAYYDIINRVKLPAGLAH